MVQVGTDAARTPKSLTKPMATGFHRLPGGSAESVARATAASLAARVARKESTLRKNFLDGPHWRELAHTYGVRLPSWGMPITTGAIRRWLRKLGLTTDWYREWQGELKLDDFAKRNPAWPLRAWVGVILEERESKDYWAGRTCSAYSSPKVTASSR